MRNPFVEAEPVAKKLKLLLYGSSGSGKTLAALTFPRPAVIDTEGGTDLYAGRAGVAKFSVLRCKTFDQVTSAVEFIKADAGKTFETLIIDPISVLYDVQKEAATRTAKNGELGYREWAKINNRMKWLYNELANLQVHVVCTARESTQYETVGGELRKIGAKPDADKTLVYIMDFVIQMQPNHSGKIEKSRGMVLNTVLQTVTFDSFAPVVAEYSTGATVVHESDDEAAARELDTDWNPDAVRHFLEFWHDKSITDTDLKAALGINERWGEWENGRKAADEAVRNYVAMQTDSVKAIFDGKQQALFDDAPKQPAIAAMTYPTE